VCFNVKCVQLSPGITTNSLATFPPAICHFIQILHNDDQAQTHTQMNRMIHDDTMSRGNKSEHLKGLRFTKSHGVETLLLRLGVNWSMTECPNQHRAMVYNSVR